MTEFTALLIPSDVSPSEEECILIENFKTVIWDLLKLTNVESEDSNSSVQKSMNVVNKVKSL